MHAAEGYARSTGKPGVVLVTSAVMSLSSPRSLSSMGSSLTTLPSCSWTIEPVAIDILFKTQLLN